MSVWQWTLCSILLLMDGGVLAVDPQGEALLSWKRRLYMEENSINNDPLADWNPDDAIPCLWTGVTCAPSGRVVELNLQYVDLHGGVPANLTALSTSLSKLVLSGANLSGPIPSQLVEQLPLLTHLDLSDNALTGSVPAEICRRHGSRLERLLLNSNRIEGGMPDCIGNLSALQWLVIYDNQLEGEIPASIGRLGKLEVFRAGGNKNLRGALPVEIGNCTDLVMLGLAETGISGPLPPTLGSLKKLQTLAIYTTMLSGQIPPEMGQCLELQNVYLYENSITGSIPPELGRLQNLQNLLLWQNNLVGVIPPELGQSSQLRVVDLSMNGLSGKIPTTIGNLTDLRELQLSINRISGPIPPEIVDCRNLSDLELDNNQITGGIPPGLSQLGNLRTLYLWANQLTGAIPAEMGSCLNLEALDLSQNNLTGSIPKGILGLRGLSKLLLLQNDLTGEVPLEIGNCSSLVRFRANSNRLTGAVPPEIGSLKNLSFLDLSSNRLSGEIPEALTECSNLTFLDLHDNSIGGTLSNRLFDGLVLLQYIDISGNSIDGSLPPNIGLLTSLTKLILSRNRLYGQIPPGIGSCSRLQLLDLSYNQISGEIPGSIGKIMSLDIAVNLSSNDLSGQIPKEFAELFRLCVLDLSHNRLSGDLLPLATLQNLVALNLSFNNFSGSIPDSPIFLKLPISDMEGNPALCLAGCSNDDEDWTKGRRRTVRVAMAVLLSVAVVLVAMAFLALVSRRRVQRSDLCEDEEKNGDLSPPWELTVFQKMEISVGDVARNLTAANVIGRGWSGVVYRARVPSTGAFIAVKKFRTGDEAAAATFASEIEALARIRHRNIVRLLGWAANRRTRLLFYDYLPNGTLGGRLHSHSATGVATEWGLRLGVAVDVAEGLAYLHHDCVPVIIHGDVKTENILLGERYEACLADFGLARLADNHGGAFGGDSFHRPAFAGSYGYIAPEHGCMARITAKSDVYSFGVVLLEMIMGRRPADSTYGEGRGVVEWVRDHLRRKGEATQVVDARLQGRPDHQMQEILQVLGIALLCASARPDDRPAMKDVAALLKGIHEPNNSSDAAKTQDATVIREPSGRHLPLPCIPSSSPALSPS